MKHWEDLAWQIQDDTERVLVARAKWLRETTGAKNLCIAGGVGLNCVANGMLARESGFENVWIQPAAGDDGIAIGCAYYGHLAIQKQATHACHQACLFTAGRTATKRSRTPSNKRMVRLVSNADAKPRHLQGDGEDSRRRQCDRLVPGPLRVRSARARQPQHPGGPAHRRDEGHPQQPGEAPPAVPAVCADRAEGAGRRDLSRAG